MFLICFLSFYAVYVVTIIKFLLPLYFVAPSCSSSCCSWRPTSNFSIYVLVWSYCPGIAFSYWIFTFGALYLLFFLSHSMTCPEMQIAITHPLGYEVFRFFLLIWIGCYLIFLFTGYLSDLSFFFFCVNCCHPFHRKKDGFQSQMISCILINLERWFLVYWVMFSALVSRKTEFYKQPRTMSKLVVVLNCCYPHFSRKKNLSEVWDKLYHHLSSLGYFLLDILEDLQYLVLVEVRNILFYMASTTSNADGKKFLKSCNNSL